MTSTRKPSSKKTSRSSGPAGPSYPAPIQDTALNTAQRERALKEMTSAEGLDVLVADEELLGERSLDEPVCPCRWRAHQGDGACQLAGRHGTSFACTSHTPHSCGLGW